jgi:serine/threonine protein kinase
LVERIGRGGFGDVWRAVELLPDGAPLRDVALKLLSPEMDSSNWAEEAKLLASFSHPSLVTIYATGILEKPAVPFVAMELLLGETLAELVRRRTKFPWRLALRYVAAVARALDVIHQRGVIHLDLKPANIFVTSDGRVKVLDFGISRTRSNANAPKVAAKLNDTVTLKEGALPSETFDSMATAAFLAGTQEAYAATQMAAAGEVADGTRVVVGTPGYVAPEVLLAGVPTMRADAYALGVTLAVLATGKLPHDVPEEPADEGSAEDYRTYWMSLRESTLRGSLRSFDGLGLPRGVVALIVRLCAVDPERRGVSEGGLGSLLDEVWEQPHGVPELPYPGLMPFGEAHEGFLFGRDPDLARTLRHLTYESLVVISGPFGAGKTSFVRAALLPALAKGGVDGAFDVELISLSAASGPDRTLFGGTTVEQLLEPEEGRARVVFIDDLEELAAFPPDERRLTVALIERLLAGERRQGFRLVLALEQESLATLAGLSPGLNGLSASIRYLAPPSEAQAKELAIEPALRAGWRVESEREIVSLIAQELAKVPVPLPMVALILAESTSEPEAFVPTRPARASLDSSGTTVVLAEERRTLDGRLMHKAGVAATVHRAAERAWKGLADDSHAMDLLVLLTTSEGEPIRVNVSTLCDRLGMESVDELCDRLRRRRLIVQRGLEVELAHPALARWSRLESARLSSLDQIALRERISEAALAWEKASMNSAYLARAGLLSEVDRQGVVLKALSGLEVEFLSVSRRARRQRRLVQLGAVFAALLVALVGLLYRGELLKRRRDAETKQKEAQQEALRVGLVARARQASDPYERIAYLVASLKEGAAEPALFVELLGAASDLPPGRFLSLEPLDSLQMPWNDRWVMGRSPAGGLVVFDLRSPIAEPESLDNVDPTMDPARASVVHRPPKRFEIAIGNAPIVDTTPFLFDTSLFAQNAEGEVHLVRLRESGEVALAAIVPFRCRGEMSVATRAPVFVCNSGGDATAWNLRTGEIARVQQPTGIFELSPNGDRLVTWAGSKLFVHSLWDKSPVLELAVEGEVAAASISPRDPVIAVLTPKALTVHRLDAFAEPIFSGPGVADSHRLAWDKRGLDVAACGVDDGAVFYFLMQGPRPQSLASPSVRCDGMSSMAPDFKASRFDLGEFAYRNFGEHFSKGGWALPGDRYLSTTLLLAGGIEDGLRRVLELAVRDAQDELLPVSADSGFTKVVRSGNTAVIQMARTNEQTLAHEAPEIVVTAAATGVRLQSARGFLLDSCPDEKVLSFRLDDADRLTVVELRSAHELGRFPHAPGFVLGLSPSCTKLYTQDLDGTIFSIDLATPGERKFVASAHGHVFEVKRSAPFGASGPGLLMGLSSGEVVRIDETDDAVRLLARANPRITALSDGVVPGQTVYADHTGVYRIDQSGTERLAAPRIGSAWEDIIASPGARALVLASRNEVAVVDEKVGAITGSVKLEGFTRGTLWDPAGAVLLYPSGSQGVARAQLLPFGAKLPEVIGSLASNLRVDSKGALALKR